VKTARCVGVTFCAEAPFGQKGADSENGGRSREITTNNGEGKIYIDVDDVDSKNPHRESTKKK